MMLTATIIVLREVLEAALLISVLLAVNHGQDGNGRWLFGALVAGLLGSAGLASSMRSISEWFDGVGLEVTNATLQFLLYALLAAIAVDLNRARSARAHGPTLRRAAMSLTIAIALAREGSEVLLYLAAFAAAEDSALAVLTGAGIGTGIGASVGALLYWTLRSVTPGWCVRIATILLVAIAGGMLMQGTGQLIQADWINATEALWDTSQWLSERSIAGQLLYAVAGYEASPLPVQVWTWLAGMLALLGCCIMVGHHTRDTGDGPNST